MAGTPDTRTYSLEDVDPSLYFPIKSFFGPSTAMCLMGHPEPERSEGMIIQHGITAEPRNRESIHKALDMFGDLGLIAEFRYKEMSHGVIKIGACGNHVPQLLALERAIGFANGRISRGLINEALGESWTETQSV